MKKRILSWMLVFAMMLSFMPAAEVMALDQNISASDVEKIQETAAEKTQESDAEKVQEAGEEPNISNSRNNLVEELTSSAVTDEGTDAFKSIENKGISLLLDAQEQEASESIDCTTGSLQWTLSDDGILRISGTGAMASYNPRQTAPWYKDAAKIKSVVIEEGATSLGGYAFMGCTALTGISIPDSVTVLGVCTFLNCTSLEQINLPNKLQNIADYSFQGCTLLKSINFGSGATRISQCAFKGCTSLKSINIPDTITFLGKGAFMDCTGLISAVIPSSITGGSGATFEGCTALTEVTINTNAMTNGMFKGCSSLKTVNFGEGVDTIADAAFYGWNGAENYIIPSQISKIGLEAFKDCTSLKSLTIPETVTVIGERAFAGCTSLESVNINTNNLGIESFYGCSKLNEIAFGENVTTIAAQAFSGCSGLTVIKLPEGITNVEDGAFSSCEKMTSFTLPTSLEKLGSGVFANCPSLTEVKVEGSKYVIEDGIIYSSDKQTLLLCVGGKEGKIAIPEGVTAINERAFYNCNKISEITLPDSLVSIGKEAFYGCSVLTKIKIPAGITELKDGSFQNCTELVSVKLHDKLKTIGVSAFSGCSKISEINLESSLVEIGAEAFKGCIALEELQIASGVSKIGASAFSGCTGLKNIKILAPAAEWGTKVFEKCTGLTSITINENVTALGTYMFSECTSVRNITLPKGLEAIPEGLFSKCSSISNISVPEKVNAIGDSGFYGCTALETVTLSDNLTILGRNAFSGCVLLKSISLPEKLNKIDSGAFNGCTGLMSIHIPASVKFMSGVFNGCTNLASVTFDKDCVLETFKGSMFCNCSSLKEITLPEGITSLARASFSNCTLLESIVFPKTLTQIGDQQFRGCTALTELSIPDSVTGIGSALFSECTNLTKVTLGKGITRVGSGVFSSCTKLAELVLPAGLISLDGGLYNITSIKMVYFGGTEEQWNKITFSSAANTALSNAKVVFEYVSGDLGEAPVITKHPIKSVSYNWADITEPLTVEAVAVKGADLSYQWYVNTENSTSGGIQTLSNDSGDISKCSVLSDTVGTKYYYCIVKSIKDGKVGTAVSDITEVIIKEGGITLEGEGTAENPYLISEAGDLQKLYSYVSCDESMSGKYIRMTKDIELPTEWKPIGVLKPGMATGGSGVNILPFSGNFDGGGNMITVREGGLPLFGYVHHAVIRNLNIYGTKIAGYGLINNYEVNYGEDGEYGSGTGLETVTINNVTLKSGSSTLNSGFIGGAASGANIVTIVNCTVEENVTIGYDKLQSGIGSFAGGFNGVVKGSSSYADVYGVNNVGGLVGYKSQSMGPCGIGNSEFHGSVNATGDFAGGILGAGYTSESAPNTPAVSIQNCYVDGAVKGSDCTGGIFGGEPAQIQCWNMSYIDNNHFAGTLSAKKNASHVGGTIGYMNSLNKWNSVKNNFYIEGGGAENGIGGAKYIDTDAEYTKLESTIYVNTAKALPTINGMAYKNYNRSDDPLGKDADTLSRMMSKSAFADGTVSALLNEAENSLHNWVQGEKYPVHSSAPVVYKLTVSGSYKDTYYIGDTLDLTGIKFKAEWSDGKTTEPKLSEVKINGFDSSKRAVQTLTVEYGAIKAAFIVTVLKAPVLEKNTIKVFFTLLGDSAHGEKGGTHTLKAKNLETWIPKAEYTVDLNATVKDVFEKALNQVGATWENPTGNYVESITYKGTKLAEFTNGKLSGWMYTLNGKHPGLGLSEQFLDDGDNIVWHYTDDYTKEQGSEEWGNKPYNSASEATAAEEQKASITAKVETTATVNSDGTATVKPAAADIIKAIEQVAEASKKDTTAEKTVVLTVSGDSKAKAVEMTIPKESVTALQSGADRLTISTSVGDVSFDADTLKTLAKSATSDLKISIAKNEAGEVIAKISSISDEAKKKLESKLNDRPVYDFLAMSGSKEISQFGGKVNMSLAYTPRSDEQSEALVAYWVKDDGSLETVIRSGMKNDGKHFGMEGNHWSTYAIGYNPVNFSDTARHWAKSNIMYLAARDVIKGKGADSFAPNAQITRAEFIQILANMSGDDLSKYKGSKFSDVSENAWYAKVVAWSVEKGIAGGTGEGLFSPNGNITRQDMSVMIAKYAANVEKETLAEVNKEVKFADSASIAGYAKEAVSTMQKAGIISGVKNSDNTYNFNPKSNATRAEAAKMIYQLIK